MRTTLVIPDAVGRRAKQLAKRRNQPFSQLVSEALEARLAREENARRESQPPYRVSPKAMGRAAVDVSDRNVLYGRMEEAQ